jgi:hypothetical protein
VRRRGIDLERQVWKDYVPSAARHVVELKTPGRTWVFAASTGWEEEGAGGLGGGSVAAAEDGRNSSRRKRGGGKAAAAAAAAQAEELALSAWVGALEQAVLWGQLEASGREARRQGKRDLARTGSARAKEAMVGDDDDNAGGDAGGDAGAPSAAHPSSSSSGGGGGGVGGGGSSGSSSQPAGHHARNASSGARTRAATRTLEGEVMLDGLLQLRVGLIKSWKLKYFEMTRDGLLTWYAK